MSGPGADAVYRDLFHLAIGLDLCADARRGADNCLASATTSDEASGLALLVRMIAPADSGREVEFVYKRIEMSTCVGKIDYYNGNWPAE